MLVHTNSTRPYFFLLFSREQIPHPYMYASDLEFFYTAKAFVSIPPRTHTHTTYIRCISLYCILACSWRGSCRASRTGVALFCIHIVCTCARI